MKIEFRDPPEGYELVWDCKAQDGDLHPYENGWASTTHVREWYPILARRKKAGLVELVNTMQDCVESLFAGYRKKYDAAERELRARLAAIEREPTDEECRLWQVEFASYLTIPGVRDAIKAARDIGQGGDK